MGFLNLFDQTAKAPLMIPTGCFSLDPDGRVVSSTMPSAFPEEVIREIGETILQVLRESNEAGLGLTEVSAHYGSLRITARDLHGGALIFLNPILMSTTAVEKA